jgi:hypothetical protein
VQAVTQAAALDALRTYVAPLFAKDCALATVAAVKGASAAEIASGLSEAAGRPLAEVSIDTVLA